VVQQAARHFPAVVVTGPRRSGKTTLLRQLFPKAQYVLLEDPDIQGRIRNDPRTFLEELRPPVLFDEIQNAPELLSYVRTLIDAAPRRMGRWLFTGSQEAPLMQGITESMAGRAAILQLLPFSIVESVKANMLHGGFPEVLARPRSRALWFASYLQTYLERDVRAITNVRDLVTFRRFLALLASRHGQILKRKELYYFRDQQGLEVDFLIPRPNAELWLIECKAGKTVLPAMATPLLALRRTLENRATRMIVVHRKSGLAQVTRVVASGVEALDLACFVSELIRDR
jgi:predicted AAA+ superfamily ATPase